MVNKLLNTLFPESCPLCDNPSLDHKTAPICTECWQTIRPYTGPQCSTCGTPLVSDLSVACGDCIKERPAYETARSYGLYEGALKKAINLFKFYSIKRLARPLSGIMLQDNMPPVDAVIPVPLHKKRLRLREFNQSAVIAKNIAKGIGADLIVDCLVKTRDTLPQVGLNYKKRQINIKNAFQIRNAYLLEDKDVLLIDDVITTGSTVRECSRALKKAGAGGIYVMALAHGFRD